jgi:hypothetical protein
MVTSTNFSPMIGRATKEGVLLLADQLKKTPNFSWEQDAFMKHSQKLLA